MRCPKCSESMESVRHEETTIDRCTACGGMWFDVFEAEDLIEAESGASVDTGSSIKGFEMNKVRDIACPRCGKQMQTVSDREDPLLKFEACDACHGYFLDAGEFRDMAHVTGAEKATETFFHRAKQFFIAFQSMHRTDISRDK